MPTTGRAEDLAVSEVEVRGRRLEFEPQQHQTARRDAAETLMLSPPLR